MDFISTIGASRSHLAPIPSRISSPIEELNKHSPAMSGDVRRSSAAFIPIGGTYPPSMKPDAPRSSAASTPIGSSSPSPRPQSVPAQRAKSAVPQWLSIYREDLINSRLLSSKLTEQRTILNMQLSDIQSTNRKNPQTQSQESDTDLFSTSSSFASVLSDATQPSDLRTIPSLSTSPFNATQVNATQEKISSLEQERAQLIKENSTLRTTINQLKVSNNALTASFETTYRALKKEADKTRQENLTLHETIDQLEQKIQSLEQTIKDISSSFETTYATLKEELAKARLFEGRVQECHQIIESLKQQLKQKTLENAKLRSEALDRKIYSPRPTQTHSS